MHPALKLIESLNAAWQAEDWVAVAQCFHEDALLLPPDMGEPIIGREAILATYQQFAEAAELHSFRVSGITHHPLGAQSAVHMRFEVEYSLEGDRYAETGLEVYWLDDEPRILWRHQGADQFEAL